jgi:hypothetical protein
LRRLRGSVVRMPTNSSSSVARAPPANPSSKIFMVFRDQQAMSVVPVLSTEDLDLF